MARSRIATSKSLRSTAHRALCALLVKAREDAGLTQIDVAKRLGKPQSFVSKYEGGERRLDVVEFLKVAKALDADPPALVRALARKST